jgi:peptidoglycan/xylan/chitin deacetylase (PgdA/CDA1 family)
MRSGLRRAAKEVVANCLDGTGARDRLAARRRRSAGGAHVLIVAYHRVVSDFEGMRDRVIPALLTSVPTFERQLETLAKSFRVVPLGEALAVLGGRSGMNRDLCVVTFDDGYQDFLENALPVLRRYEIPSTLYVPTGFIGGSLPLLHDRLYWLLRAAQSVPALEVSRLEASDEARTALGSAVLGDPATAVGRLLEGWNRRVCIEVAEAIELALGHDPAAALSDSRLLDWDDLRFIHQAGVEIGAHTIDHACLHTESPQAVLRQVRDSKTRIEEELGSHVVDFAYPNGWYSQSAIHALQEAGYRSAVTTEDRLNSLGEQPFALKRKIVWEYTSRGLRGFSTAVAACNFNYSFPTIGVSPWVTGEKPDLEPPTSPVAD